MNNFKAHIKNLFIVLNTNEMNHVTMYGWSYRDRYLIYCCFLFCELICVFDLCPFTAPITNVEAIEGQQAHLYCPMTTPNSDRINMVLWFRDDVGVPIYR